MTDPKEIELIKYTIILNHPLPRREEFHKRWFIDGRELTTEIIHNLLKGAGYNIEFKEKKTMLLANKYKGIKLVSKNGGLMVYPKNPLNFNNLKKALLENGYFYHSCYMPTGKKLRK